VAWGGGEAAILELASHADDLKALGGIGFDQKFILHGSILTFQLCKSSIEIFDQHESFPQSLPNPRRFQFSKIRENPLQARVPAD